MKLEKKHWAIIGVVLVIIIVCCLLFRKKETESSYVLFDSKPSPAIKRNIISNQVTCRSGCTLSTNTTGASSTVTVGNVTYTCRCSDGSTTAPTTAKT